MDSGQQTKQGFANRGAIIWLAAICLCVLFALSHSFSSMAIYDDESYVMMTIKTFLEGDRLYSETYTQYGPAYYMIQQPIHGWLSLPITHDVMRLKTVATWILIGLLSGVVVTRLTENRFAGVAAMMLSVLHLQKLGLEPAHPQEVVTLLASLGLLLMSSRNRWFLFAAGVCAALAGLAKLNVGAVAAAGCLFAAGFAASDSKRLQRFFAAAGSFFATGLAAAVLATIAKRAFASSQPEIIIWPLVIFASSVLVCAAAWFNSKQSVGKSNGSARFFHPLVMVSVGGIVGSALVVAWSIMHGNGLYEILHGVVLQHGFMSDAFYHPIQADRLGLLFVVPAVVLLVLRFCNRNNTNLKATFDRALFVLPVVVLAIAFFQMAVDCWQPLSHGLKPRGAAFFLATVGPALMPILLLNNNSQLRRTLAMIGCLSPILAFPVPGTQVSLGTLPILIGLVVLTHDRLALAMESRSATFLILHRSVIGLAALLVLVTGIFSFRWTNSVALDQPGCRWVRLDADRVARERAIADCIRETESPWLAFDSHNHNRFFFWTGKEPLTSTSPTFWPAMLTEEQKSKIESAAQEAESICVVKLNNEQIKLIDYAPAIEHVLFETWQLIDAAGEWQVGITR